MEAEPKLLSEDIRAIEDPRQKAVIEMALNEAREISQQAISDDKCAEHIASRVENALIAIIQKHPKD